MPPISWNSDWTGAKLKVVRNRGNRKEILQDDKKYAGKEGEGYVANCWELKCRRKNVNGLDIHIWKKKERRPSERTKTMLGTIKEYTTNSDRVGEQNKLQRLKKIGEKYYKMIKNTFRRETRKNECKCFGYMQIWRNKKIDRNEERKSEG